MKIEYDEIFDTFVIPYKCGACNRCRLKVDRLGKPTVYRDALGRERLMCVYGGPYPAQQGGPNGSF